MREKLQVTAALAAVFMSWAAHADDASDFKWTGFYVGGHAGLSWAENKFYDVVGGADTAKFSSSGYLGGVQAGHNWQIDQWVFGAEAEGSASHLRNGTFGNSCGGFNQGFAGGGFGGGFNQGFGGGGFGGGFNQFCGGGFGGGFNQGFGGGFGTFGTRVEALGLVSGRVGYSLDRTLLFGKGGLAIAHEKYIVEIPGVVSATPSETRLGWIAGAGVEHALTANWSVKIEYNYIDLGTDRINVTSPGGTTFAFDQSQQIQLAKVGFNYRF